MLDWIDNVRPGAINHGSGAPSTDPGVLWAEYTDDDTGDCYVWNGSAWVQLA